MSLTQLQFRMMDRLAHDEYNATNGSMPTEYRDVNCWLFVDEFAKDLEITEQQAGGVLASLENAGYIGMQKCKKVRGQPDESSVWFTPAGYAAWFDARNNM